ncbi:MAG TPA: biotin--[acetyl-CoA-carboxylase] ligase [Acidimicrobiia bacterium]
MRREEVSSTQDLARAEVGPLPVVVIAQRQTEGRGRSGAPWMTAPRALAVSVAFEPQEGDERPFSLMAGVAAALVVEGVGLKWPNDLLLGSDKVGGILVEQSDGRVVVGLGLNLWWPEPSEGAGALHEADPGEALHAELGALWAAELLRLVDLPGWPVDEYRKMCVTLGKEVAWEPEGSGRAVDVTGEGELVVDGPRGRSIVRSGAVRHLRDSPT